MFFIFSHKNRLHYPTKHSIVVSDNISSQIELLTYLNDLFGPEGFLQTSVAAGSLTCSEIIIKRQTDLVFLDGVSLSWGTGINLLEWLHETNTIIPIITCSKFSQENQELVNFAQNTILKDKIYLSSKEELLTGQREQLIRDTLGLSGNESIFDQ